MESEGAKTGGIRGAEGRAGVLAAVATVAGFVDDLARVVAGSPDGHAGNDPLRAFADACLDGLEVLRRVEAAPAPLNVRLVDGHVGAVAAMEDPASGPAWVKWKPTPATKDDPPGWISPGGRSYSSEHQDWQPPHWPPGLLPGQEKPAGQLPGEEPPTGHLIEEDDLSPDHEAWDILLAMPITVPPDPCNDWELALT